MSSPPGPFPLPLPVVISSYHRHHRPSAEPPPTSLRRTRRTRLTRRTSLKKLPANANSFHPDASNLYPTPEQEAAYLRAKHLGLNLDGNDQKPLGGFGGRGRPMPAGEMPLTEEEEKKYWAQMIREDTGLGKRVLKGGHGVPLSGE